MPATRFTNSPRLDDLVKNGKIYLSLSDAITLALENNYDIAIARYNLDIADTDILRSKSGAQLRGVNAGIVQGTLGGAGQSLQVSGGGPGGTINQLRRRWCRRRRLGNEYKWRWSATRKP